MITAMYSCMNVYGAEIWLGGVLICALFYLAVCCSIRRNRTKKGVLMVFLGLLVAEVICDAIWASAFYPGGEYHNYGLGGSYMRLMVWPGLLILAGVCVTLMNGKRKFNLK